RRAGPARRRAGRAPRATRRRGAAGDRAPGARDSVTARRRYWALRAVLARGRGRPCIFIYHPMLSAVLRTIATHALFQRGDRVLVAVSGGPDSMSLLHALWEARDRLGIALE